MVGASHLFYCEADCRAPLAELLPILRIVDGHEMQAVPAQLPADTQLAWHPALDAFRQPFAARSLANVELGSQGVTRSDERRVGKEGVSTCRSRWSRSQSQKKNTRTTTRHTHTAEQSQTN